MVLKASQVISKKGTWKQAILTFISPIVFLLFLRWAFVEPFVIPSESMLPNLLIHDHIMVQKFAYGLRVPFVDQWLVRWSAPQVGDIVVFKYPQNPEVYYVKRLIGLPGDRIDVRQGRVERNAIPFIYHKNENEFDFSEWIDQKSYSVRIHSPVSSEISSDLPVSYQVPSQHFFVMGDNRDNSSDSRVWGFVPESLLVGKAWMIWLSCQETLEDAQFICDPLKMRWNRIFKIL